MKGRKRKEKNIVRNKVEKRFLRGLNCTFLLSRLFRRDLRKYFIFEGRKEAFIAID
jgi:hypothetical protein